MVSKYSLGLITTACAHVSLRLAQICPSSARFEVLKQLLTLYCFGLFVCLFLESGSGTCCINQADFKFIEIHLCLPLIMCFKMKD